MKNLLLVIFTLSPLAAFAQNSILERSKAFAESEVVRLEAALTELRKKPFLPCDFRALNVELKYNQWITNPAHYEQLTAMNNQVDETIAAINKKLESLASSTVNVLVTKGQDTQSSEMPVAFKDLIDFFTYYNLQMKNCPKDQRANMLDILENEPASNPMKIALSQIRAAGGMMTVKLNASLQEKNSSYELVMTPEENGYRLEIRVIFEGFEQPLYFSLLDDDALAQPRIELSENKKWESLSKQKVDGMPVDGLTRYRLIQDQHPGTCENAIKIPMIPYGVLYVKSSELPTISEALSKRDVQPLPGMKFTMIQPGSFLMGSTKKSYYYTSRGIQHSVTLTQSFEMQTTELTQAQWFEIMGSNPSKFKSREYCPNTWSDRSDSLGMCPQHPVENISWEQLQIFIQKLNELNDGYVYRLPTEAEWEYAARGKRNDAAIEGKSRKLKKVAWFDENSGSHTHEVASLLTSEEAHNLYDMHGNVAEWVQDFYGAYSDQAQTNPKGPSSGDERHVYRGGDWHDSSHHVTSSNRDYLYTYSSDEKIGARLVRTLK